MNKEQTKEYESQAHILVEKYIMSTKLHKMYLERELKGSGVFRSQHQILMSIAKVPNASQKEIAQCQQVSTATIAVALKKLEKGGYISRAVDAADNRFNQICITPKGQEVVEQSKRVFQRSEKALFQNFSQEEMDLLEDFLDRMRWNLEKLLQEEDAACEAPDFREKQTERGKGGKPYGKI